MRKRQEGYHTLTCPLPIDRKGNSSPARLILSGAPRCLLKNRSYHKAAAMSNRGCNQHLFSLFTTRLGSALPPSPPIAHRLPHYFPPPPPPPTPHHSHPSVSPAHSSVGVGLSHPLHACVYCRHGWIGFGVGGGGAEIELSPSSTPTTHLRQLIVVMGGVGWGGFSVGGGGAEIEFSPSSTPPISVSGLPVYFPLLRPFRQLTVAPTAYMYILSSWVGWVGFDVEGGGGGERMNFLPPPPHPSPLADFLFTSPHPSHPSHGPSDSSLSHPLHTHTHTHTHTTHTHTHTHTNTHTHTHTHTHIYIHIHTYTHKHTHTHTHTYIYILSSWVGWIGFDVEEGVEGGQRLSSLPPPPHPSPLADFLFTSPHQPRPPRSADSSVGVGSSHAPSEWTVII